MTKKINLPITDEDIKNLKAGDSVLLTGTIITGRDAAHKRLFELLEQGKPLPVDLRGEVIYYGKPYKRIYEYALEVSGITDKSKIIAIGDNVNTDIKGAKDFGINAYLVDTGIKSPK